VSLPFTDKRTAAIKKHVMAVELYILCACGAVVYIYFAGKAKPERGKQNAAGALFLSALSRRVLLVVMK
jgi:hypothetical protein